MLYIEPGSPWENGYAESFFSRLRDELLNVEEFLNLAEARWFAQRRLEEHNHERPHSSLGYQPPPSIRIALGCFRSAYGLTPAAQCQTLYPNRTLITPGTNFGGKPSLHQRAVRREWLNSNHSASLGFASTMQPTGCSFQLSVERLFGVLTSHLAHMPQN